MAVTVRVETDFCVYAHSTHGKVFYVGMGNAERAFTRASRSEAWLAYVDRRTFDVTILGWFDTASEARAAECRAIRRLAPECNLMHNGWRPSPETIAKAAAASVAVRDDPQWRERQSAAQKARKGVYGKLAVPVRCVETGIEYTSISAAARAVGATPGLLHALLRGEIATAKGLTFRKL